MSSTPAAAGRRAHNKQRTRAALLAAAADLFLERHFDDVTTEEIATRAGVSLSTLFRYFPTKISLVAGGFADLVPELLESIAARPPEEAPFVAMYEGYRNFVVNHRALLLTVSADIWRDPAVVPAAGWSDLLLDGLTDVLTHRNPDGPHARLQAQVRARAAIDAVATVILTGRTQADSSRTQTGEIFRAAFAALDPQIASRHRTSHPETA